MKMKPMPEQTKKYLVISIYFALAVSTFLVFWQVRNFDFVSYDDNLYIYDNPHVLNGLTADSIWWAFATGLATNWHPLTWLSLMLDCQLFGANAGWMHLVNLLLHLANTLLLFAVLKKMTGSMWPSAFVAAAFALHPMHVQSVAWITERKDVLSTFFLLLTLAAYAGYVSRPSILRYAAALAAFALGLMAKPMLVTLPVVLLLLDYWPLNRLMPPQTVEVSGRRQRKSANNPPTLYRIIIEKVPFLALSIISSIITLLTQPDAGTVVDIDIISLNKRIANAFLSYAEYIAKMLWPRNLAVFYPLNIFASIPFWQVTACALLLLGISFLVVRFGRSQRYLPIGWFWFVVTLIPVISIVQGGRQAYADRYTYVPYIGLFIMIAWGLPRLLSKWPRRKIIFGLSMAAVLTPLGICAYRQTSFWKDSITLFSHAIEVTQNNYVAYNNLGNAYDRLGRWSEAVDAQKQAVKIRPDSARAYYNLGVAYNGLAHWPEAIDAYRQAIRIKPNYTKAHNNLGYAYLAIGDKNSAMAEYNILKSLNPEMANNLLDKINK